ncbi:Protein fam72a [Lunasporangiospora selenospora]|uniref:Protein fam72a n=1 Tax=Lunasporangiospora selenospora TaxID=979761 RepID=A0A9P6KHI8_9FUNG|nr:Protein fam72a [Lunasporangiospora selenospora]
MPGASREPGMPGGMLPTAAQLHEPTAHVAVRNRGSSHTWRGTTSNAPSTTDVGTEMCIDLTMQEAAITDFFARSPSRSGMSSIDGSTLDTELGENEGNEDGLGPSFSQRPQQYSHQYSHQPQYQQGAYFAAQFAEFMHSMQRLDPASDDAEILSDESNDDLYRSLMTAVSSIQVSRSMHDEPTTLPSGLQDLPNSGREDGDSSDDEREHYNMEAERVDGRSMARGGEFIRGRHALTPLTNYEDTLEIVNECDIIDEDGYSVDMQSLTGGLGNMYDLQHMMARRQREFESHMRQAREEYSRIHPAHTFVNAQLHRLESGNEDEASDYDMSYTGSSSTAPVTQERGSSSTLLPSPISVSAMADAAAAGYDLNEFESDYRGNHVDSSTQSEGVEELYRQSSISASYFSPTSESVIVLSSPPPSRASGSFPSYHSQQSNMRLQHNVHLPEQSRNNGSTPLVRHVNGPYRPFVTGTDLRRHDLARQQQNNTFGETDSTGSYIAATAGYEDQNRDELDADSRRILEGEGQAGHWFALGSLSQSTSSFEQHRSNYYRQQTTQEYGHTSETMQIPSPSLITTSHLEIDLNSGGYHSGWGPHSTPTSQTASHSGLTGSSFPSNIPLPSRYFQSPHLTARFVRPHDIMTSHGSLTGYQQLSHNNRSVRNQSLNEFSDSSNLHRRRTGTTSTSSQTTFQQSLSPSYSETVERAEAGGWAPVSHPANSATAADTDGFNPSRPSGPGFSSSNHNHYRYEDDYRTRRPHGQLNIGLKEVVRMACRFCQSIICERGMKAQLLADQTIGLFSTDDGPQSVQMIGADYRPTNCFCKIRDTACVVCGNAIGYHITQPCEKCLGAENNGHLWLFHPEYVYSCPRFDPLATTDPRSRHPQQQRRPMRWEELPEPEDDLEALSLSKVLIGEGGGEREGRRGGSTRISFGGIVRREYDAICR